jgi:phosphotransferase system HPr (HPr) family protein
MLLRWVRLDAPHGLHARPCSRIAETMKGFRGQLRIRHQGRSADASSVLDLMTLNAPDGAVLELLAEGEDAARILDAVVDLFRRRFEN